MQRKLQPSMISSCCSQGLFNVMKTLRHVTHLRHVMCRILHLHAIDTYLRVANIMSHPHSFWMQRDDALESQLIVFRLGDFQKCLIIQNQALAIHWQLFRNMFLFYSIQVQALAIQASSNRCPCKNAKAFSPLLSAAWQGSLPMNSLS